MKKAKVDPAKAVRLTPFGQYDTEVQILVKIGTHRFPLSVDGAKQLRDRLCSAVGRPPVQ